MKRFVIGDIHGYDVALKSVLKKASFDYDNDMLICLGDVCDRGPNVLECIKHLKTIKNLVYVIGNHDGWTMQYLGQVLNKSGVHRMSMPEFDLWQNQGGMETMLSIKKEDGELVFDFLSNAKDYFELDRMLFVHGGINPHQRASDMSRDDLMWDRGLVKLARGDSISLEPTAIHYDLVFVGHTPTQHYNRYWPVRYNNVWMLDCGIAYGGTLAIMDIDSKQFWQNSANGENEI